MKCPRCESELEAVQYEGLAVSKCPQCFGYLAKQQRLEGIKKSQQRSVDELKREVLAQHGDDASERLRCPRCRRRMDKQRLPPPAALTLDRCGHCQLVWLDGGELARLQLSHELRPQSKERVELQRRWREMPAEQRQQFEQNLSRLPEGDLTLASAFSNALRSIFARRRTPWESP